MKAMHKNKNAWIGFVVLLIIVALGLWWVSASAPVDTNNMAAATSTQPTSTTPAKVSPAPKPKVVDNSVSGVVANLTDGTRFASLYASTGVASAIVGSGPYTVFVPTNEAYGAVAGTIANMTASEKKQLVTYHVVVGKAMDPSAILSGSVQALSRDYINFSIDSKGKARINNAYVVASYKATNGIVYLVSSVLFPPKQ